MEINFKGFQNTGIGVDINRYPKQIIPNNPYYICPPYYHLTLTTKLTNDGDKDLLEFEDILKKYPDYTNNDTINFHYDRYYSETAQKTKKEFWLNDKPLILNDSNLGVFSKLSKLLTKLSKCTDNELMPQYQYLNSDECKNNFRYFIRNNDTEVLKDIHKPSNIRQNAKDMAKEFQNIMFDYFKN